MEPGDGGLVLAIAIGRAVVVVKLIVGNGTAVDTQAASRTVVELSRGDVRTQWGDGVVAEEQRNLRERRGPIGGDGTRHDLAMPKVDPIPLGKVDATSGRAFGRDGRDEDVWAEEELASIVLSIRIAGIRERQRAADREARVGGFAGGRVDIGQQAVAEFQHAAADVADGVAELVRRDALAVFHFPMRAKDRTKRTELEPA